MTLTEEPYFRIFGDYPFSAPVFYSRAECPWLDEMEANWRVIRAELDDYCVRHTRRLRASYVPDDVDIQGWTAVNFVSYLHWYPENCREFPRTLELLRAIPDLTTAFISILGPGAGLPPHNGDTNTTYRCHLGLIVPAGVERCGLQVGGQRSGWREGEAFAFNEAHRHFVWNETAADRAVLVFDVLKPEYRTRKLGICGDVLAAMTYTALETKAPLMRRLPRGARRLVHRVLGWGARAVLVTYDRAR